MKVLSSYIIVNICMYTKKITFIWKPIQPNTYTSNHNINTTLNHRRVVRSGFSQYRISATPPHPSLNFCTPLPSAP